MSESKPRYVEPAAGQDGMTELHHAAYRGDIDAVVAAIQERADVDAPDHGGWTALHWLVDMGMVEGERERILAVLVAAGANLDARDLEGSTPLMIACRAGNADLVRRLVDAGAAINAANHNGRTALMEAASYGEPQTVILLLAAGADRSARTQDGKTARTSPECRAGTRSWRFSVRQPMTDDHRHHIFLRIMPPLAATKDWEYL